MVPNYKHVMKQNFEFNNDAPPLHFQIDGDPIPYFKSRHTNRKTYDSIQGSINKFQINLGNQLPFNHVPQLKPLLAPLFVNLEFYLPYHYKNETFLIDRAHFELPKLTRLIEFVEECLTDVHLINECGQIASLFAKKYYSDKPRTEFLVHEIVA